MTPKKREATLKRIGDIEKKIAELTEEARLLKKQLENDDKERLVGAVKKNRLTVDDAIALISTPKNAEAEKGNINVTPKENLKKENENEKPKT